MLSRSARVFGSPVFRVGPQNIFTRANYASRVIYSSSSTPSDTPTSDTESDKELIMVRCEKVESMLELMLRKQQVKEEDELVAKENKRYERLLNSGIAVGAVVGYFLGGSYISSEITAIAGVITGGPILSTLCNELDKETLQPELEETKQLVRQAQFDFNKKIVGRGMGALIGGVAGAEISGSLPGLLAGATFGFFAGPAFNCVRNELNKAPDEALKTDELKSDENIGCNNRSYTP